NYFRQRLSAQGSTGSSTMPHKVNPIRFENAEAHLEISCALLDTLGATLITSRLQRDLTDSTSQRNIGVALGHSLLAIDNVTRGLAGLDVDAGVMAADLEDNWEVLGEAVQSAMRAAGIAGATGMEDPYERLKVLTRVSKVDGPAMREFIGSLGLPGSVEARLLELTPATYTGPADNWEVLGDAVQSAMRAAGTAGATGMEDPYERLKELTRGRKVDGPAMREFLGSLGLPGDVEARLLELTPATYIGLAAELV